MRRIRNRKRLRLEGYDYTSPGAYFITTVTHGREPLFGEIVGSEMRLNAMGKIVCAAWYDLPNHYACMHLDAFVVMPNHVHGIIVLVEAPAAAGAMENPPSPPRKRHGIPEIVRAFKSFSARRINELRGTPGIPVWQRGYHDRIIRNQRHWERLRVYIMENPRRAAGPPPPQGMV